jgi:N-methylhydantoinase A/oxoprolinase/acetone carboxylase beta subunit
VLGDEPVLPPLTQEARGGGAKGAGSRATEVHFPATGYVSTPVVGRGELEPGTTTPGPLVVESMDTTVVVPPEWLLSSDDAGILELQREPAAGARPTEQTAEALT